MLAYYFFIAATIELPSICNPLLHGEVHKENMKQDLTSGKLVLPQVVALQQRLEEAEGLTRTSAAQGVDADAKERMEQVRATVVCVTQWDSALKVECYLKS